MTDVPDPGERWTDADTMLVALYAKLLRAQSDPAYAAELDDAARRAESLPDHPDTDDWWEADPPDGAAG